MGADGEVFGVLEEAMAGGILAEAVGEAGHGVEPAPVDGERAHAVEGRGLAVDGAGGGPGGAPGELILADVIGGQRGPPGDLLDTGGRRAPAALRPHIRDTHDATGAGSAIGEFPALAPHDQLQGVTLVGRVRTDLFRNYIGAIEQHEIVCPRIDVFYTEHLYCGEDELFGSGHPPDTVVAMALAYHAFKTGRQPGDLGVTL